MASPAKEAILARYFRKVIGSPDGAVVHHGDCRIFSSDQCSCGLIHDLEPLDHDEAVALYPGYDKDLDAILRCEDAIRQSEASSPRRDPKIVGERQKPKLWEEMSPEEHRVLEEGWRAKAAEFHADLVNKFWEGQRNLKILRERLIDLVPMRSGPASEAASVPLPDAPGHYLWYVLDWGYLDVGMVQVIKDPEKHLLRLQDLRDKGLRHHLVYQNSKGETLSMYHEAHDHVPYRNSEGVPWVDGYVPIDFNVFK